MSALRSSLAAVSLLLIASTAAAQTPPPGTSASAIQSQIEGGGLRGQLLSRISASGLSADQVRQRLAQLGYDPTTLDPYLNQSADEPPAPSDNVLAAVRSLGVLEVPAQQPGTPAATTPAVTPAVLPVRTEEEREEDLRVFGLDVFARSTTQFQPVTTGPVPDDYVLGPGDELVLILTGDVELAHRLPVTREGFVVIPQVGEVPVNGVTLSQLREQMYTYLGRSYSGITRDPDATTNFQLSLGQLRTNQVFVTGEVAQPGSYLISPVASVLNALYLAGGPSAGGSFRNVQIVTNGRVVQSVDLYDYLLQGNNLGEIRLNPGDVIFVPVHGPHVSLRGEVQREAIFEMNQGETLADLLDHAGGLTAPAQLRRARVARILPPSGRTTAGVDRTVFDVDLADMVTNRANAPGLLPGDDIRIFAVRSENRNTVNLSGSVWHEGSFGFRQGMSAWDLIRMADGLTPDAYLPTAHIVRLDPSDSTLSIIPFRLDTLADGTPVENPALREFDDIRVFARTRFEPEHSIEVHGAVRDPGTRHRFEGMTVRDAILRSGGLIPELYTGRAFISRLLPDSTRRIITIELPVDSNMIPLVADSLEDFDIIRIPELGRFIDRFSVSISGQVHEPITREFEEGMTLGDLVWMAGGLTFDADLQIQVSRLAPQSERQVGTLTDVVTIAVDSSFFFPLDRIRYYVGNRDSLSGRTDGSAWNFPLQPFDHVRVRRLPDFQPPGQVVLSGEVVFPGTYILQRQDERLSEIIARAGGLTNLAYADGSRFIRDGNPVGLDLEAVLNNPRHRHNIVVHPGDELYVPAYDPVVVVQGAVNSPSSIVYREGAGMDYYIDRAGGYAQRADRGRAYVRFANGATRTKSKFLFFTSAPTPGPGSTILVPAEDDREGTDFRGIFSDIAQIIVAGATLAIIAVKN